MAEDTSLVPKQVTLPEITNVTVSLVDQLIKALRLPREILSSNEDIATAWKQLPALLTKIPPQLRDPLLVRMCVAVSVGLLDAAINYAWNSSMVELRNKVRAFGVNVVPQILGKPFDDKILEDMQDSELLALCLGLNLLTEDGYFMLDQCRDVRNNFSAAHPPIGTVDAYEYLNFLNRCAKYALTDAKNPRGVDVNAFLAVVKGEKFNSFQRTEWIARMRDTHEAQRDTLISTLHGIYCDPGVGEEARLNALDLAGALANEFSSKTKSELLTRHTGYSAEGKKDRHSASQKFFAEIGLVGLLSEAERHAIVSAACRRLMSVHQAFNNFYNEPPFAERLLELSSQGAVPETAKEEFVETIVTCSVGNAYGTCRLADADYTAMIRRFSPKEVDLLFQLLSKQNLLTVRVKNYKRCEVQLRSVVSLIDEKTVPSRHRKAYQTWLQME